MKHFALAGTACLSLLISSAAIAQPGVRAGATNSVTKSVSSRVMNRGRVGAPVGKESALAGGNGLGIAMLVVVLAGAAWGAYEMIDGDNNEGAVSN